MLLSASVRSDLRRHGVGAVLLEHSREIARRSETSNLVGPFRPADFGTYKTRDPSCSFDAYGALRRDDGARVDRWLRALDRAGLELLRVEPKAMVVETTAEEFRRLRRS